MTEGYGFLRFLYTKYSEVEYVSEAWAPINDLLKQHLDNSIETCQPISYQAIYCCIYKSTCRGYKERLFTDVKKVITDYCQNIKVQLDESMRKTNDDHSNRSMNGYILQFIDHLRQFHRAIEAIVPLFHYLDVVYIKPKIRSTIRQELSFLYKTIIMEVHLNPIFNTLRQLVHTSDSPSKEIISLLLKLINEIAPNLAIKQRHLFKRYCNNEDVFNEMATNGEDMVTPASRTSSKRSAHELPDEEGKFY
ncbi:hypothetical protein I4U23_030494 [Adineta vaga]|nr:hypothetical protein I4U23_030494 [Adineta vaga]